MDKILEVKNAEELDSLLENEKVDELTHLAVHGVKHARLELRNNYGLDDYTPKDEGMHWSDRPE